MLALVRTVDTLGTLPASTLSLEAKSTLHGLLCRAFGEVERAADVCDSLGLPFDRSMPVDHAWLDVIKRQQRDGGDLGPLAAMACAARPNDPAWRRVPNLDAVRALRVSLPTRARDDLAGRPLVARISPEGAAPNVWGSAWRIDATRVLTAAHCLGDRTQRTLTSTVARLWFPERREVFADLCDVSRDLDWDLDVALLTLRAPERDGLRAALVTSPANGDPWRVYGFPKANPSGQVVTGEVTDACGVMPSGRGTVRVPAAVLTCDQGGLGELEGCSGAPVWSRGGVVGMVRHGTLHQRVIYATSTATFCERFHLTGAR